MRILLVTTSYPQTHNGSEAAGSFVEDFARQLSFMGHSIGVVYPALNSFAQLGKKNPVFFPFKVPHLPLSILSISRPRDWIHIVTTLYAGNKATKKAVDEFNPDFVFALWVLPSGFWVKRSCRSRSIRYGTWALGSDIWTLGKIPIVKRFINSILKESSINFADGYKLKTDVQKIGNGTCTFLPSTRKLNVMPETKIVSDAPFRLGFIGRWHTNKGIDLLLGALNQLDEKYWDRIQSIYIAGGGPLENLVKEQVDDLLKQNRPISLHGYVNKDEVVKLFSKTDFLIIPSRIESIPVVFSDAMQAGCPIIASPVGDIPQLINQFGCGVLAESVSEEELAVAIATAVSGTIDRYVDGVLEAAGMFNLDSIGHSFIEAIDH